jgi:hypothetical protein
MARLTGMLISMPPLLDALIEIPRRIEVATNGGAKSSGEGTPE